MHQIAKINHCETSILGGNGIAVKLTRVICQRAGFRFVWQLFGAQDLVAGEDATAIELAAFGEGEFYAMAGVAKRGDS